MKNSITYIATSLILVLMFSSCGSNLSVIKRQHNKGYYVSFNKLKQSNETTSNDKIKVEDIAEVEKSKETIEYNTNENEVAGTIQSESLISTDKTNSEVDNDAVKLVKENKSSIFQKNNEAGNSVRSTASKIKNVASDVTQLKSPNPDDARGHSLLWIIVVVLLILWLLGYLGGIGGGLIHLLLVIALILFILWLLGII